MCSSITTERRNARLALRLIAGFVLRLPYSLHLGQNFSQVPSGLDSWLISTRGREVRTYKAQINEYSQYLILFSPTLLHIHTYAHTHACTYTHITLHTCTHTLPTHRHTHNTHTYIHTGAISSYIIEYLLKWVLQYKVTDTHIHTKQ